MVRIAGRDKREENGTGDQWRRMGEWTKIENSQEGEQVRRGNNSLGPCPGLI